MSHQERRSFQRINFDADTQIRQGNRAWSVVLVDISMKGLLIEEPFGCGIDPEQTTSAHIILGDDSYIDMDILWRHHENGQIGFECRHIDIDSISHLRRLIELNIGDSSSIDRELALLGQQQHNDN